MVILISDSIFYYFKHNNFSNVIKIMMTALNKSPLPYLDEKRINGHLPSEGCFFYLFIFFFTAYW